MTTEVEDMARPRGRPKRSERDDVTVKLDRTLAGRAKILAGHRGVTVAELITEALRTPLSKMWGEMIRETDKEGR